MMLYYMYYRIAINEYNTNDVFIEISVLELHSADSLKLKQFLKFWNLNKEVLSVTM